MEEEKVKARTGNYSRYCIDISKTKKKPLIAIFDLYKSRSELTQLILQAVSFYMLYARVPPGSKADPNLFWATTDTNPVDVADCLNGSYLKNGDTNATIDTYGEKLDEILNSLNFAESAAAGADRIDEAVRNLTEQMGSGDNESFSAFDRDLKEIMRRMRELEEKENDEQMRRMIEESVQNAVKSLNLTVDRGYTPIEPSSQEVEKRSEELIEELTDLMDLL